MLLSKWIFCKTTLKNFIGKASPKVPARKAPMKCLFKNHSKCFYISWKELFTVWKHLRRCQKQSSLHYNAEQYSVSHTANQITQIYISAISCYSTKHTIFSSTKQKKSTSIPINSFFFPLGKTTPQLNFNKFVIF